MSKSKKNYVDPTIILDHEGADALRWYLDFCECAMDVDTVL